MDGRIFYDPLAVLGKKRGLIGAVIVTAVLTAVAWWGGVYLDGALDLHIYPKVPSGPTVVLQSLIAWLSLGLLLSAGAKVFRGNGGAGSYLAAAGLSRFPYILAAILMSRQLLGKAFLKAVTMVQGQIIVRPQELVTPGVMIGTLALVGLVVWSVVMLYLSYTTASRLQGARAAGSFAIGVVLAEIVSKLLLAAIGQGY